LEPVFLRCTDLDPECLERHQQYLQFTFEQQRLHERNCLAFPQQLGRVQQRSKFGSGLAVRQCRHEYSRSKHNHGDDKRQLEPDRVDEPHLFINVTRQPELQLYLIRVELDLARHELDLQFNDTVEQRRFEHIAGLRQHIEQPAE